MTQIVDTSKYSHHPAITQLTNLLCNRTQNFDEPYFRVLVASMITNLASDMRAKLLTEDRGEVPINMYALALAPSGYGKGYSISIMEDLIAGFKDRFINETMPECAAQNLEQRANSKAARNHTAPEEELAGLQKYYQELGEFPFTFSEGNSPACKQLRQKLLLANCGALNLCIDEIGSNLLGNTDILNLYLELYDQGVTKQKLTKNTKENLRGEDISGKTPANMLLFGTPVKLLDGGQVEDAFYSFLETGYARRFLFAFGKKTSQKAYMQYTPTEAYDKLIDKSNSQTFINWKQTFYSLADPAYLDWKITVPRDISIKLIDYKFKCEKAADEISSGGIGEIRKAEISHRYFRALKLAGTYAFLDTAIELTEEHLNQAIKLTEESGQDFERILNRPKNYERLARHIAEQKCELTHADLVEQLPFYKTGNSNRKELMDLARSWGIKNNILIKTVVNDGIEFFSADTLKVTDLNNLIISGSDDIAYHYQDFPATWDDICTLGNQYLPDTDADPQPVHWINHYVREGHRCEDCIVPGFNLIVLDVDGTLPIKSFHDMFKDYKYALYTTKRSTPECERYRVIFPVNFTLELDKEDYKEFMNNVLSFMPFAVDPAVNQRAHKWLTNPNATLYTNEGKLFDALPFIPHTKKNESFLASEGKIANLGALEKWFTRQFTEGNRNNVLFKYAMCLVDAGKDYATIERSVKSFNNAQENKLPNDELESTVLTEVAKKCLK